METYIYEKIRDDFVMLRYLTYRDSDAPDAVSSVLEDLEQILPYIQKFGTEDEQEVLGYAVRTAAELAKTILPVPLRCSKKRRLFFRNPKADKLRRVNAFCDAVHNLCELFTTDTWNKEDYYNIFIAPFRLKFGNDYFREVLYFFGREEQDTAMRKTN